MNKIYNTQPLNNNVTLNQQTNNQTYSVNHNITSKDISNRD